MAFIYKVTVEPIENGNKFRIIWQDQEKEFQDYFIEKSGLTAEDTNRLWHQPQHQLEIGRKLFRFLDGDSRYLQRALDDGYHRGEMLQLHIYACEQVADWPFELLAVKDTFLLPHHLHLVRRVSDRGEDKQMEPENRQIKMLFMACSAVGVTQALNFEREEEVIFNITKDLAIDMEVEDSGSLEGLSSKLIHQQFDVSHISGHAKIDEQGLPLFIMEQETGYPCEVSPETLWTEALLDNPPRLLFLSGCRTGEEPIAKKAGLEGWRKLLGKGISLSLIEYDQSRATYQLTSLYGDCHPDVATDLNNLGMACLEQGDCKKAISYFEEALSIWKKIYGPKHANAANALNNLGQVYIKMKQEQKAKKYFEEAYAILNDLFGSQHKYTRAVAELLNKSFKSSPKAYR